MAFENDLTHHEPNRRLNKSAKFNVFKRMLKYKKNPATTTRVTLVAEPDESSKKNIQTSQTRQSGPSASGLSESHGFEPASDQGPHSPQNKGIHKTDRAAPEEKGELEAPTAHGLSSPQSRNSQNNGSNGAITEDEGCVKNLWMHAYEILKTKDPEVVTAYEGHLTSDDAGHVATASPCLSLEIIPSIIESKLEDPEINKLILRLSSKPVKVREQGEEVVKFILWSKRLFSPAAIHAQPFAALAWSGILNLLCLMLEYSENSQDMVEGLNVIADLLRLYKHKESVYLQDPDEPAHPDLVTAIQELYVNIFEYEVRLICFLARKWSKLGAYQTIQLSHWKSMLKQVKDSDEKCNKYCVAVNEEKARLLYNHESSCMEQAIDIRTRVFDIFEASRTQRQNECRDDEETASLKRGLLESLASDYKSDKNSIPAKVPGTCEWFLEDDRFINWRSNKRSGLLWVSAGPGCGKSVLSRALIDEKKVSNNVMTSSVCYFFFQDGQERRTRGTHALSAIIHQLFKNTNLVSHALSSYKDNGKTLRDNISELWDILLKSAKDPEAGEIICILDALDECEEKTRSILINNLISFASPKGLREQSPFSLKFLVTSRPYDDIEEQFQSLSGTSTYLRFDGDEKSQQIGQEINLVIDAEIQNITSGFSGEDRQLISDSLKMKNNRTYLWLYLNIDIIKSSRSKYRKTSSIKELLSNLPSKVSDAYERILAKSPDKKLARTLLQIIVAATRPLSLMEANIALTLAQQGWCTSHKTLDLWSLQNFRSLVQNICGFFVSIHDEKLSLIHQTAREYLIQNTGSSNIHPNEWQGCLDLAMAHSTVFDICFAYLQFDEFSELIDHNGSRNLYRYSHETRDQNAARNELYPFFDYAAINWVAHYNSQRAKYVECSQSAAQTLCNNSLALNFNWLQVYLSSNGEWTMFPKWTKLGVASFFGLGYVVENFLNEGIDFNAPNGSHYALYMASYAGHAEVVQMLLDDGASINAQVDQIALQMASGKGHEKAVQVLIQHGADVNANFEDRSVLELASYAGHDEVVRLLLEKGANPNHDCERESALYLASSKGHEKVVRMLLGNGADVNAQSETYGSALQMACSRGDDKLVQILLENGADVNIRDSNHESALHCTSMKGSEKVMQILLENGADVNARAKNQNRPLHLASWEGCDKLVQMLLENGADINALNQQHESALQTASFRGHSKVMQLLFENGADVGRKDVQGRTPTHLASVKGDKAMVEIFSSTVSVLEIVDEQGRNCLHHAACGGFVELVSWLIGKGFDPNLADRDGWTALHWAAKNGSLDTVEVLLRAGAKSTVEAIKGWTPYSVAAFHGNSLEMLTVPVTNGLKESKLSAEDIAESLASASESADPGIRLYNNDCHGCLLLIVGTIYRCPQCPFFKYCFKCNASSSRTHAGHNLEAREIKNIRKTA